MNIITKKLLELSAKHRADTIDSEDPSIVNIEEEGLSDSEINNERGKQLEVVTPKKEEDKSYTYVGKDGDLCRLQPGEPFIDPHTPEANPSNADTRDLSTDQDEIEDKENESDPVEIELEEDTSGAILSQVDIFLEKYEAAGDIIQILRRDLMQILSDVQWILESNNKNEQWALDFADALNELSVKI